MKTRTFRIPKLRTCLALLPLALLSVLAIYFFVLPAVHRHLGLCPLGLSKFDASKAIPILYGLPMSGALKEAKAGRIILGGCVLGNTVAVCPHCHVGVKFRDWDAELKELHLLPD